MKQDLLLPNKIRDCKYLLLPNSSGGRFIPQRNYDFWLPNFDSRKQDFLLPNRNCNQIFVSTRLHHHCTKLLTITAFRGQNSIMAKYWSLNIVPCHVMLPIFGSGKYIVSCGLFSDQIYIWSSIPNATNLCGPHGDQIFLVSEGICDQKVGILLSIVWSPKVKILLGDL